MAVLFRERFSIADIARACDGATACGARERGNRSVDSSFEDSGCVVHCEDILLADGHGSCDVEYIVTEYLD